ncbi:MAG: LysR family transcriptional regulator [Pseudomonadota bacterium]|uniref:LysR family transcriptional regulator n=1 Tax=Gallaecimonas pentaromativorans TaxID=584787 RepID=UPI00067F3005|nr:LysR family transcriptional regulator [Gallaecimonas pentaromativorans]MED5526900.1 LysR family transcriptional regulator [Pseudomonadota bacterium]
MDTKALRYFHEVAKLQSFTLAAQQLGVAQPAVSMAIRKLESELNLSLFHRQDRKVTLTDEGRRLLPHAERILTALTDAEHEMDELRGLGTGEVRVGIPSMLGSYYFPPILMAFRHRYPSLNLSVIEAGTWQLRQMLEAGELDLAVIVSEFLPPELEARVFLTEEMRVTVAKDHPFAGRQSIDPQTFFDQELVMFQEGYFHRKIVDRLAREAGRTPNIVFQTNLIPLIKSIVKQGFGISTLLKLAVDGEPDLVSIPFSEPVWLELSIAWRRGSYLSRANTAFVNFLLDA